MLLGGPAAGLVFGVGVTWLGLARPGYSAVRQTVSELGPLGGPGRISLAALNLVVALCSLIFACGLAAVARPLLPALFMALYAVLVIGLAAFPSQHRVRNVFGLLQTIPFIGAPLAVALGWRGDGAAAALSWVALVLLILGMALNLAPAFSPRLAKALAPVYGLVQRSLFIAWYAWCAALGLLLLMGS